MEALLFLLLCVANKLSGAEKAGLELINDGLKDCAARLEFYKKESEFVPRLQEMAAELVDILQTDLNPDETRFYAYRPEETSQVRYYKLLRSALSERADINIQSTCAKNTEIKLTKFEATEVLKKGIEAKTFIIISELV